jgi:hypothetical protein
MSDLAILPSGRPANPGLDYAFLRDEGTRIVQLQAGRIWTDYNESDPGVTTLEQLCYALTELSYRADTPLPDLLVGEPGGAVDGRRQALHTAGDIFPVSPVTADDYRRLLIDRVPRVANAWITPYRPSAGAARGVAGLWDIALYVPGADPVCNPDGEARVADAARRVYCAHRNLCEDVRSVTVLREAPVTVNAEVALGGAAAPDEVLAALLFRLGDLFAPEPARQPLDRLVREGVPPSEIFQGPLPLHGFIPDAELGPKADAVPVEEVVRTVVATPGVAGLRRLTVQAGGGTWRRGESVPVGRGRILRLETKPARGAFSIRLFSSGVEVRPDPAAVERGLRRLWARRRRTWPLEDHLAELFGIPAGEYRDVGRYVSVQDQFPAVYGIGAWGLPADASTARRAQARQLKGYLLPFEQLMADYFSQLAHARDLFSTLGPEDPDGTRSYWYQYLDASVPDVKPLLRTGADGYCAQLPALVQAQDPWMERRGRFLAFLLSLYADGLEADEVAGAEGEPGDADGGRRAASLYRARLGLLRRVVESTRDRFRAFDYLRRPSAANAAEMELRCRVQLGMPVDDRRPLQEVLREHGVELQAGTSPGDGAELEWHAGHIESAFHPVAAPSSAAPPSGAARDAGGRGGRLRALPAEALDADLAPGDLRVGTLPGDDAGVSLVSRTARGWRLLGRFAERAQAIAAGRAYRSRVDEVRRHARQLYVVEHLLLRAGRYRAEDGDARRGEDRSFPYGAVLTAVFFLPASALADESYRAFAREVVRSNAPAHLAVECCFLPAARGIEFESLFRAWQQALESGGRGRLRTAAARLREFLRACDAPPPASAARRRRREG